MTNKSSVFFANSENGAYDELMAQETVTNAQKRLLDRIKRTGPMTAGHLAEMLGMTDVAVRQHLTVLERDGRVRQERRPVQGRGRPSMVWSLAPGADQVFPDRHADLTVDLINAMRREFGEEGLARIVAARADEQIDRYGADLPGTHAPLESRVQSLAAQRTAEGYMAEVACEEGGGYLLIEHHCPICPAARICAGLCAAELDVFRRVLGPDVSVERTAHALAGEARCAYLIQGASQEPD